MSQKTWKNVESQRHRKPSWISVTLGRLGTILVSRHETAGSEKESFISDFRRNPSVRETFPLDFKNYGFKQQTVDIHLSTPIILKKDCMKMCDQYRSSTRILIPDNVNTYLLLEFHGCKFEIVEVVISHLVFIGSLCKRFYGAICSRIEVAWRPGMKISSFAPPRQTINNEIIITSQSSFCINLTLEVSFYIKVPCKFRLRVPMNKAWQPLLNCPAACATTTHCENSDWSNQSIIWTIR